MQDPLRWYKKWESLMEIKSQKIANLIKWKYILFQSDLVVVFASCRSIPARATAPSFCSCRLACQVNIMRSAVSPLLGHSPPLTATKNLKKNPSPSRTQPPPPATAYMLHQFQSGNPCLVLIWFSSRMHGLTSVHLNTHWLNKQLVRRLAPGI